MEDERNTEPLSERVYKLKIVTTMATGSALVLAALIGAFTYATIDLHRTDIAIKRGELDIANASTERAKHDSEAARANEATAMWNHMQCVQPAEKKP
jgi:hypothetical protein